VLTLLAGIYVLCLDKTHIGRSEVHANKRT
jgi:hypothetical protein